MNTQDKNSHPVTSVIGKARARYRNARAVIDQIRRGEWNFHYNPMTRKCYAATRKGRDLWVGEGAFYCDTLVEPAFGLIFRHWVWHAAAKKEARRVTVENRSRDIPDLTI